MIFGIIIPYRDRADHLQQSSPILKQYGKVYVIEQMDKKLFNRGKLINVGYLEFKNEFDYFAAHDVDMIPEIANYSCPDNPCHLATEVEQFGYKMPYDEYFGGVTLFPNKAFEKINGFYNSIEGWGAEDDLVRKKILELSIPIQSRQCRFKSLQHIRDIDRQARAKNASRLKEPIDWGDGLTSCKYEVVNCEDREHYTLCQVKI